MNRSTCQRLCLAAFALCSVGAKDCAAPSGGYQPNYFCYTDPPVGCAAYCTGLDDVTFTPACSHISAGELERQFEEEVIWRVMYALAQGVHLCPEADPLNYVTPCQAGIIPQEWPNQDHAVCTPVPPGCPL